MHKLTGILDEVVLLTLSNRPSKIIKSPYVADAVTKSGRKVLVHTPFLNLGGQCKVNPRSMRLYQMRTQKLILLLN